MQSAAADKIEAAVGMSAFGVALSGAFARADTAPLRLLVWPVQLSPWLSDSPYLHWPADRSADLSLADVEQQRVPTDPQTEIASELIAGEKPGKC